MGKTIQNTDARLIEIRRLMNNRIEEIRRYCEEIEQKFDKDIRTLEEKYKHTPCGPEEADRITDYLVEEYLIVEDAFMATHRRSILISIYSYLECSMNDFCRLIRNRNSYGIDLSDMNGKGIFRAQLYLAKVANIDMDSLNGHWSEIVKLNKIRNFLVHSGENAVPKISSDLSKIADSTTGIKLDHGHLKIEKSYITSSLAVVDAFLKGILQQAFSRI